MKLKDLPENYLYIVITLGALLFILLGVLAGYYIGINIAESHYLPRIENCNVFGF